jgi:uncharacterized protein YukE
VWVLGVLGFQWVNIDEDKVREAGQSYRTLGSDLSAAKSRGDTGAQSLIQVNKGQAVDAFGAAWEKLSHSHVKDLITACDVFADVLEGVAVAVEVAKGIILAQVIIAAAAFAEAAATAIFTLGLSALADLAVTQGIKEIIRIALKDLEHALIQQAKMVAEQEVLAVIESVASNIIDQGLGDALGVSHGFSVGAAVGAGWQAGVANAKGIAAAYTDPKFLAEDAAGMLASSAVGGVRGAARGSGNTSSTTENTTESTTAGATAGAGEGE